MNSYVCIKQVPDTAKICMDPIRHTLIREGVSAILNPYDEFALETALRLKETCGGTVIVLTMGPPQARGSLESCLAVGADMAFLISDAVFGGSDTLATSRILSASIREIALRTGLSPGLILCGRQAIDGDTGQVGPALAEQLGLPQVTNIRELRCQEGELHATRILADEEETLACRMPALVTLSATPYSLRLATVRGRLAARQKPISILDHTALRLEPDHCGLAGSPTRVVSTFVPEVTSHCTMLSGRSDAERAELLLTILKQAGISPAQKEAENGYTLE